jgi:ribosomal protein S27E
LNNGQGGIDCINCGKVVVVTTRHDLEVVERTLDWELGDPKCPSCGNQVTFEDYIDD